jgi:hypothetical protein
MAFFLFLPLTLFPDNKFSFLAIGSKNPLSNANES